MTKKSAKTAQSKVHEHESTAGQQPKGTQPFEVSENTNVDVKDNTSANTDDENVSAHELETLVGVLNDRINVAEERSKEIQDKYLRLSAEFDNYRKRTLKEKSDIMKLANEDLLKNLLPVVDDFERGIDVIDKSQDIEALKKGIHLIYNKFTEFIRQNGIKEIEAREQSFDLDLHEALTKIPAPDESLKGKVVDVIEKGYYLNDKVIRFAKVVVGE